MAHNTLLKDSINSNSSANILKHIIHFYELSLNLQKGRFYFLTKNENIELLENIYQSISNIIDAINIINKLDSKTFNALDILKNKKMVQFSNRVVINSSFNFKGEIIANKELIEATILLLSLLQLDEHKLKYANIYLDLDRNRNYIDIQLPQYINFNSIQKEIIYEKKRYYYSKKEKKFYGLYILFLKKLIDKCGGKLKIYTKHNSKYKVLISIPIKFYNNLSKHNSILSTLNKKILIYTNSRYTAHKIKEYLINHQLFVEIKIKDKMESQPPNFLNYNLIVLDSSIIDSKIVHLLQIAKDSGIKILLLSDKEKRKEDIDNLADIVLNKPFNYNELTFSILNFYAKEPNRNTKPIKSKKRVLIADDDIANLKLLEFKFKQYDVDTFTARNGKELISLLEKNGADLIVVDSIMPIMDGYEAAKYIRAKKRYKNIPIIIHSSFSFDSHTISNIFHYGFDDYLPKPFSHKDIEKIFKNYLTTKEDNITKEKKRFFALYKDIDKLIEKYTKENRVNSLSSLLANLKKELISIKEKELAEDIEKIEYQLNETTYIDNEQIRAFIKKYCRFIENIKLK